MTKVDIISGFLGAGKTTFIKKLLSDVWAGEKLVLIENEFGEIGIDGGFLKDAGIEITEMNSGCICCTLVGDFSKALVKVLDEYHPDRVIIEPSGVGKLSDVARAIEAVEKDADIEIDGRITVVDGKKAKMYMKNFGEFFKDQVEHASTIVVSRTQMMTDEKVEECVHTLREENAEATIISTPWDELGKEAISHALTKGAEIESLFEDHEDHDHDHCDHDHHDHHDHDHDHCDHDHHDHDHEDGEEEYGIGSFVYHRIRPFNQDKLQQFVENWPKSVVRAKGVLWFDDKREDVYVFEQAGVQITATEQGKWLAAFPKKQQKLYLAEYPDMAEKWDEKYGDREIKLVFIGQHMDRHAIVDALDECLSD